MSVPNTFASATSAIPLANLDADFAYYDAAFQIVGTAMEVNYTFRLEDPTDTTKKAEFVMSGITTGTTRLYTMPNASGTLATLANTSQTFLGSTVFAPSTNSGTITIGGIPQTGTVTLGRSTASQTVDIAVGATTAVSTKTVNIGTTGVSGSTTNINIGSAVAGSLGAIALNSNTTMAAGYTMTLNSGTANGVTYLNGSKVLTSGTALTFDGAALTATSYLLIANSQSYFGDNGSIGGGAADGNTTIRYFGGKYLAFKEGVSEQMRLTSTGLGIGTTSFSGYRLNVVAAFSSGLGGAYVEAGEFNKPVLILNHTNGSVSANLFQVQKAGSGVLTLDSSGNLGLGVTPSAWATFKVLQIAGGGSLVGAANQTELWNNAYYDGAYKYYGTGLATRYQLFGGEHRWSNAPSGTAGAAITFTQAMTLDASGNLLVGQTARSQTVVGAHIEGGGSTNSGTVSSILAASTNAASSYNLYSTGAGAFRFYVGMSGTIFATSTTITAISDQRLKENIRDLDDGLDTVMALKPRKFDWKEGKGKDIKDDRGFIAQEFGQVLPDMIEEWKDPAPEGEEPYKAVNANLIPTLVKAIQEQQALIESLTQRLAALESK